jgi:hypothetical protein
MGRDVVEAADRADERTGWKNGENLSFTHGTVLYASHARMALVSQKHMTSPREDGVDVNMRLLFMRPPSHIM